MAHALYLGMLLWTTNGASYYLLVCTFLVISTAATKIGSTEKERLGIAEKRGGKRNEDNLWGAAGIPALLSILIALLSTTSISNNNEVLVMGCKVGFVASVATKAADTISSEIGKAYGRTTVLSYNLLKRVPKGTEGAVSLEGSLAGVVVSLLFAVVGCYGIVGGARKEAEVISVVVVASVVANYAESIIGATVQEKVEWLSNEQVNLINTAIGGTLGILLSCLIIR